MSKPLKILFISFIGDLKESERGFVKKDLEKFEALNKTENVTCHGVSFSDSVAADYWYKENYLVKKLKSKKKYKYFDSFFQKINEFRELDKYLEHKDFDVYYSRYDVASLAFFKFVKKHSKKIVFEHNSKEYDELYLGIQNRRKSLNFSLKPGYFLYYFESKIWPLFCERFFGPKIRKKVLCGICVTSEIEKYQKDLCPGYLTKTITNGVKYDSLLLHKAPEFNGKELRLFMLLGTGAPWHGVDRILQGLKNYSGQLKIKTDLIGCYSSADEALAKSLGLENNIFFHNLLSGEALTKVIDQCHLSIGTLALHRKNLKEASPLKVRESLMRGFPVITAYNDTDIDNEVQLKEFILKLPANDSPVDFNVIENFALKVLKKDNYPKIISETSRQKIAFDIKAKETVEFISNALCN